MPFRSTNLKCLPVHRRALKGKGNFMLDVIYILISLAFFGVAWAMIKMCDIL